MLKFEVSRNVDPTIEVWNVEALDRDGICLLTVFYGPAAKERAYEYAYDMNRSGHSWETAESPSMQCGFPVRVAGSDELLYYCALPGRGHEGPHRNNSNYFEQEAERIKSIPEIDRTKQVLSNGNPVTDDHREIDPVSGMQKGYIVLTAEERSKGFVRPVRLTYTHKVCGSDTTMAQSIAETYARDPGFYSGTFCCDCRKHLPLDEFVWKDTNEQVGS